MTNPGEAIEILERFVLQNDKVEGKVVNDGSQSVNKFPLVTIEELFGTEETFYEDTDVAVEEAVEEYSNALKSGNLLKNVRNIFKNFFVFS